MNEPVEHIERARLPWREEGLTQCGRPMSEMKVVLTLEQAQAKFKELGRQRFAMTSCMSCVETVNRHPHGWDADPVSVLTREMSAYGRQADLAKRELLALTLLYEAHRDEFDEAMVGLAGVGNLDERRRAKTRRA